jgi:PAS domain S-box-containing protein
MTNPAERRVQILAPLGRDAALAQATLSEAGIECEVCSDLAQLCRRLAAGVGALLLTQEALSPAATERLQQALEAQPAWSDLPLVVLVRSGAPTSATARLVARLASRANATFFERPLHSSTLVSAVRAALRSRQRQYETREQLQALERAEEALRQSEERFRLALRRSPVMVFGQDLNLRYTWVYNAGDRLSARALLGRTDAEILTPLEAERVTALKQRVLRDNASAREEIAVTVDGQLLDWDLTVEPMHDRGGALQGLLGAAVDVTERRALERLQREFTAMVSHELRNPLASIKGFAQLMQRRGVFDERAIETIVGQANLLQRLVDDLLEVSRLEAGHLELRAELFDLAAETAAYAEQAQAQSQRHVVRVEVETAPLTVRADRGRIGQVLLNLLSNAIKYAPGGGEILVRVEGAADEARVSVQDQGLGIPREALPRLFERFFRVDASGRPDGSGLGLYIARRIVEAHGGRIWAESDGPGQGSTFRLSLPLERARPDGLGLSADGTSVDPV